MSSLLNELADRVGEIFTAEFKRAGYDPKAAPIYANALIGMVAFVGQWWTEVRKPSVEPSRATSPRSDGWGCGTFRRSPTGSARHATRRLTGTPEPG